ncbi:MAG: hypothetical protein JOZ14_20730 [Acidobacteria bacterium]|nr:hypothetical protein [Acidobacteriota bacterium]
MRGSRIFAISLVLLTGAATGQKKAELSDAEYTAKALSAAPKPVAAGAAVVRVEKNGDQTHVRDGTNGYTCMVMTAPMCIDNNGAEFFDALMRHRKPPDRIGLSYMLAGDEGASNTDPYAEQKTTDNHWVVTGPHIMLVGPASKLLGYPENPDPDPSRPYMMWAGTPYEHAMIPVAMEIKPTRPAASKKPSK